MSEFLPNICIYYGYYMVTIFLVYAFGHLLCNCLKIFSNNVIEQVFLKFLLGTVIMVTLFAIIWAKGNTVLLIAFISFVYFAVNSKNRCDSSKFKLVIQKDEGKALLGSWSIFSILFIASYVGIFVWRSGMSIFGDTLFYSNVSSVLIESHIETTSLFAQINATPYHYGELWFNGLVSYMLSKNYYFTLFLITYPFFLSLCGIGATCICKRFIANSPAICFLIGVCFILFAPLSGNCIYYLNHFIFGKTFEFSYPVLASFKLAPLCSLMIGFFLTALSKNSNLMALLTGLILAFYTPAGPAIVITTLLFFCHKQKGVSRILNRNSLFCMAISLFILLFYAVNSTINATGVPSDLYLSFSWTRAIVHCAKLLLIEACILIVPVIFYISINKDSRLKTIRTIVSLLILPIILLCIISAVISQIHMDGEQLFVNYALMFNNIAVFTFILYLYKEVNVSFISLIPLSVVLYIATPQRGILYHQLKMEVGDELISSANTILHQIKGNEQNVKFGYFANYNERFSPSNFHLLRLNLSYPCTEFMYMSNRSGIYKPYCLSAMDIPQNIDKRYYDTPKSQLYKFINRQITNGTFVSNDSSIESFIIHKDIGYILIEDGAEVPSNILSHSIPITKFNNISLVVYSK